MAHLGRGHRLWITSPRLMLLGPIPVLGVSAVYATGIVLAVLNLEVIANWATPFAFGWTEPWRNDIRLPVAVALVGGVVLFAVFTFAAVTLVVVISSASASGAPPRNHSVLIRPTTVSPGGGRCSAGCACSSSPHSWASCSSPAASSRSSARRSCQCSARSSVAGFPRNRPGIAQSDARGHLLPHSRVRRAHLPALPRAVRRDHHHAGGRRRCDPAGPRCRGGRVAPARPGIETSQSRCPKWPLTSIEYRSSRATRARDIRSIA